MTKISQWHLGKNVKQHETIAIVRKQHQRKAIDNKDSVFRIRGRKVEAHKIERFIRKQKANSIGCPSNASPAACELYPMKFRSTSNIR